MTNKNMTNEEPTLKIGDVVVLKSGGPAMTIVRSNDNGLGEWECAWIDYEDAAVRGVLLQGSFPPAALKLAKAS